MFEILFAMLLLFLLTIVSFPNALATLSMLFILFTIGPACLTKGIAWWVGSGIIIGIIIANVILGFALGGVLGIICGCIYSYYRRIKDKQLRDAK